ncbi:MAG: glycosyl hydrolase 115 family protein [Opitutales bacterium]|nr:glycosyl hydrolase 115 family protein [Opitutales bacterium]
MKLSFRHCAILVLSCAFGTSLQLEAGIVCDSGIQNSLEIANTKEALPILVDTADWWGVSRASGDLKADIERVSGILPEIVNDVKSAGKMAVIVGTLGKSAHIDAMAEAGKIDASLLEGRWESFLLEVVEQPLPGIERALVIAGSDKRGTIYGIYTLSQEMGVSPWYWFADVPTARRDSVNVSGRLYDDGPTVKYRGIFINDEAPAFSGWAAEKFGGVNSECYSHIFELLLRLKGNYMWPAMWNNAFNEDDPESPRLADAYGIVMGTSHHEPMIRSQKEWHRNGTGAWNYETNGEVLRKFWADGIARNKDLESIVTMGMRGDGDEAMSEDTNTALLEKIVADQRTILVRETGKNIEEIPQMWALYKEVQDYYEHGMRVPDDVTLLWCDDNWGNIRRLPLTEERKRSGGAGIYYHVDYVGGPRSYKWLNTIPLTKIWEQMHLAWQYEATRIWIVNVGDLKPMELPISFFLDYGWDPEALPYDCVAQYQKDWAAQQFGAENAAEIASLLDFYTKANALRKPEMTAAHTFSVLNHAEAEDVLSNWKKAAALAEELMGTIPAEKKDAFFQLVYYPVVACANLNEMYISAARNDAYAHMGRASANTYSERVRKLFAKDQELARQYNEELAGGKWSHMMDQKNIGWTYWQQPPLERAPAVSKVQPLEDGAIGVSLEAYPFAWPENDIFQPRARPLPVYEGDKTPTVFEVFNRSDKPVDWAARVTSPWAKLSLGKSCPKAASDYSSTLVGADSVSMTLLVDWAAIPADANSAEVEITGMGPEGPCKVLLGFPLVRNPGTNLPWLDKNRAIALEASTYSEAVAGQGVTWKTLENYGIGYGRNAVTTLPSVHERLIPGGDSPHLAYDVFFKDAGEYTLELQLAPTLNFLSGDGIKVAISIDDAEPQILTVGPKVDSADWGKAVSEGVRKLVSKHKVTSAGEHRIKVWYVDPGVVVRQIIVNTDALAQRPSYLGPLGMEEILPCCGVK